MEWEFTLNDIIKTAGACWKAIGDATVIAFHGPMGVGKTTFIHAMCELKEVKDTVASPTFSIINEYEYIPKTIGSEGTPKRMYHIDLYRVNSEEEARQAGVEDCLYSGDICLVEWPEKATGLFPVETVHIYLELINTTTRRLRIAQ